MKHLFKGTTMTFKAEAAETLGVNEAIVLQQLYYLLSYSPLKADGYTWYAHTYDRWNRRFCFWSKNTIKRTFSRLEEKGYIISTKKYNQHPYNRKKWYRLNYEKLASIEGVSLSDDILCEKTHSFYHENKIQNSASIDSKRVQEKSQKEFFLELHSYLTIEKELKKEIKEKEKREKVNVEMNLDPVSEIINYLNAKTSKQFKTNTNSKYIMERLQEGYTLDNLKQVVDLKASQWLHDSKMNMYLRPSTLFSMKNFENYLNESHEVPRHSPPEDYGFTKLDFTDGEDGDWEI